jgi:hypothetical protein
MINGAHARLHRTTPPATAIARTCHAGLREVRLLATCRQQDRPPDGLRHVIRGSSQGPRRHSWYPITPAHKECSKLPWVRCRLQVGRILTAGGLCHRSLTCCHRRCSPAVAPHGAATISRIRLHAASSGSKLPRLWDD